MSCRFCSCILFVFLIMILPSCDVDVIQDLVNTSLATQPQVGLILSVDRRISTKYGAQLALAEINAEGGILGQSLNILVRDSQGDAQKAAQAAEELISEHEVAAIIGPNFSGNAAKVGEVAQRLSTPMVATTATNPKVTAAGDFVFLAAFADTFQGQVMASFARRQLKAKTVALLVEEGNLYVEGLAQIFADNFTALGGQVVSQQTYASGDLDFVPQLTAIAAQTPDIIFAPGFAPEVPLAAKQARTIPQKNASGITATFLGGDSWESQKFLDASGPEMNGSYFSSMFSDQATQAETVGFIQAYRSMFGIAPDKAAAMGYDALKLVATAMRRAGSMDKAVVRDQIAATRGYQGATTIWQYDANRHPKKSAVIFKIQDGRMQFQQQILP